MSLLDNLVRAYRVNAGVYEDESGNAGPDGTNLGSPTTSTGDGGEDFLEYNGSTQSSYAAFPSTDFHAGDFSFAVRFRTSTTPSTTTVLAGLGNSANNFPAFVIRGNGNSALQCWMRNDAAAAIKTAITNTNESLYNNSERIALATYNSATDTLAIKELTLVLSGSTTTEAATGALTVDRVGVGAWPRASATWPAAVDTSWFAVWNKVLTAQDETDLAASPWPFAAAAPNVSTYNTDLSEKAGFQTLQVKVVDADTANNGLFASDVITVEDDMEVTVETVKDGVTINLATDGNISVDKTELDNAGGSITLNPEYFSPGTGNISTLPYTFTAPVEPGLSPVISGPETPNAIELSPLSLGYTITNRNGEAPTLTGVDAALFSITNTGGDNYSLAKLTNTGAVGTTYNVTINIDNLSEPAVTLPITITCIAATASAGMNKLGIKIGIGL